MTQYVVVSRHQAAVEFIRETMPKETKGAPVLSSVTVEDVRGRVVIGNVPMHLAAEAEAVIVVEFAGDAPRGAEYGIEAMRAAGARLTRYTVRREES